MRKWILLHLEGSYYSYYYIIKLWRTDLLEESSSNMWWSESTDYIWLVFQLPRQGVAVCSGNYWSQCQTRLLIRCWGQIPLLWLVELPQLSQESHSLLRFLGNTVTVGFPFQLLRDGASQWIIFSIAVESTSWMRQIMVLYASVSRILQKFPWKHSY